MLLWTSPSGALQLQHQYGHSWPAHELDTCQRPGFARCASSSLSLGSFTILSGMVIVLLLLLLLSLSG
jgi:hypothetical protein